MDIRRGHRRLGHGRARRQELARALLAAAAILGAWAPPAPAQTVLVSATVQDPAFVKLTVAPAGTRTPTAPAGFATAVGTAAPISADGSLRLAVQTNASWELLAVPRSATANGARILASRPSGNVEQVARGASSLAGAVRLASGGRGAGEVVVKVEPGTSAPDTDVAFVFIIVYN